MTTKLTKPVARLVEKNKLIVTMTTEGLYVREMRKRKSVGPLSYEAIQFYASYEAMQAYSAKQLLEPASDAPSPSSSSASE